MKTPLKKLTKLQYWVTNFFISIRVNYQSSKRSKLLYGTIHLELLVNIEILHVLQYDYLTPLFLERGKSGIQGFTRDNIFADHTLQSAGK